ncbi:rRNA adenine methyltransferase, partial [Klebsiella pneumoniae]|nr:rRNA adenine methyltransferase [Klebsiella pneumoniae]
MSKYCLFLIVIYYLTGGNNSMSRFCKFGKLHVTKGNVDKLLGKVRISRSFLPKL